MSKKMYDENLIYSYEQATDIPIENILFTPTRICLWQGDEHYILLPTLENDEVYNFNALSILSVNRYSPNKDIAVDYIASYISKPNIYNKINVTLYKDKEEYNDVNTLQHEGEIKFSNDYNYSIFERPVNNSTVYNGNLDLYSLSRKSYQDI